MADFHPLREASAAGKSWGCPRKTISVAPSVSWGTELTLEGQNEAALIAKYQFHPGKPTSKPPTAFAQRLLNPILVYTRRQKCFFLQISLILIVSFDNWSGTRAWILCSLSGSLATPPTANTYIHTHSHIAGNTPSFFHGGLRSPWVFASTVATNVCVLVVRPVLWRLGDSLAGRAEEAVAERDYEQLRDEFPE